MPPLHEHFRRRRRSIVRKVLPDSSFGSFRAEVATAGSGLEIIGGAINGCRIIPAGIGEDDFEQRQGERSYTDLDTGRIIAQEFDRLIVTWETNPANTPLEVRIFNSIRAVPVDIGSGRGLRMRHVVRGRVDVTEGVALAQVVYDDSMLQGGGALAPRWRGLTVVSGAVTGSLDGGHDTVFGCLRGFVVSDDVDVVGVGGFEVVIEMAVADKPVFTWKTYKIFRSHRRQPGAVGVADNELVVFGSTGSVGSTTDNNVNQSPGVYLPGSGIRLVIQNTGTPAAVGTFFYHLAFTGQ